MISIVQRMLQYLEVCQAAVAGTYTCYFCILLAAEVVCVQFVPWENGRNN